MWKIKWKKEETCFSPGCITISRLHLYDVCFPYLQGKINTAKLVQLILALLLQLFIFCLSCHQQILYFQLLQVRRTKLWYIPRSYQFVSLSIKSNWQNRGRLTTKHKILKQEFSVVWKYHKPVCKNLQGLIKF